MRIIRMMVLPLVLAAHGLAWGGFDGGEIAFNLIAIKPDNTIRYLPVCLTAELMLRSSARQGDPEAQYQLGQDYLTGGFVEPDLVQAYVWLTLASANDHQEGPQLLALVAQKMNSSQIAEAQMHAREWMEKHQ